MEGLYLHNLIFFHIFNDNSSIMRYVILGWGLPIIFIIPWVVVRTYFENTFCWTTNEDKRIFWIIRGPITATIILNFVFFINITRVLFVKMFSSSVSVRQYKYKTWFKSTFILVPLFGVHYMFLLVFNSLSMSYDIFEIIWLYIDLLFSSFQGCVVALLYCFFNGEVQTELHKLWQSWRRDNQKTANNHNSTTHMSYLTQSLTYLSRGRNSCFSTAATAADSSTLGHKEAANSQSRSPSPSSRLRSTQIVTQSMNYSLRGGDDNRHNSPKTSIRSGDTSNMSAIVIVCDKQSYLNGNNSGPTVDSNQESMM
ncbi:unnamed protein product [Medioppia subpectinata]|uniref:G-protein coupled receptors family 2 profile 2 domain-containing protein n=1 Tax=Medioppia subpectinata TaxID=1979941 RepID=A0A7R9L1A0_9ACAR|nr:unnamed protein product [Medioppia subpectinata]CAG2112501.1 unnamed protein product [Medioppia subpectinata]